jgi:hypothetical protein
MGEEDGQPSPFLCHGEGRDFTNRMIARFDGGGDDLHIPPPPTPPSPRSTRTAIERQQDDERLLRDFVENGDPGRNITHTDSEGVQSLCSVVKKVRNDEINPKHT